MTVCGLRKEDGVWSWAHAGIAYRTNNEGEGIWMEATKGLDFWKMEDGEPVHIPHYEWQQVEGTCDFWLRDMSMNGARKKLNRHFGA